jgi:TonB family protein
MAKAELFLIEERDEKQRALGCVGLSAFAHVGLLIMVLFAPSLRESAGVATGTKAGIEMAGDTIVNAAPAGVEHAAQDSSAPVEVMLADASDPNAVQLPNSQPVPEPQAAVEPPPPAPAAVVAAAAPVEKAQAKPKAAKAPAKIAKQAVAAPAPAPVAEAPIETSDAGDIAAPAEPVAQVAEEEDEAVPLQVALPESESLTEAQAEALQAPNANLDAKPAPQAPVEPKQQVTTSPIVAAVAPKAAAPTGLVITHPANAAPITSANGTGAGTTALAPRGLPASNGAPGGTVSGMTQSRGGAPSGFGVPSGAQVRDARSLEAMPGNPLATYPLPDRLANRQGTTVLLGHVRNDGRIENITLEQSSGSRMMDESAAKAFSKWKYKPGQEGYVRLPVQFKLVGDAHIIPAELSRQ